MIRIPATPPAAPAKHYDLAVHAVRSGETYATLSKQMYGDVKYAKALEQWLQNHGSMADAIKTSGLKPGTSIHVPQSPDVLRAEYASLIP